MTMAITTPECSRAVTWTSLWKVILEKVLLVSVILLKTLLCFCYNSSVLTEVFTVKNLCSLCRKSEEMIITIPWAAQPINCSQRYSLLNFEIQLSLAVLNSRQHYIVLDMAYVYIYECILDTDAYSYLEIKLKCGFVRVSPKTVDFSSFWQKEI